MKKLISGLFILLVSLTVIVVAIGCSGKEKSVIQEESISTQTEVETSESTEETTIEETTEEKTTEEKTTVEETTVEEVVELSSCVVLPEAFCEGGEPICYGFEDIQPIGFNVPPGTEIRSPFDGLLVVGEVILEDEKTIGKFIDIKMWSTEEILITFSFRDVIPEEALQENEKVDFKWGEMVDEKGEIIEYIQEMIVVKKGEVVGQTTEESPSWPEWGKRYNLEIWIDATKDLPPYIFDLDEAESFPQFFIDMDFIQQYFPYIKECEE